LGGGVDKMAIEEYKRRWQILVSARCPRLLGANIVRLYKQKAQIIILESRKTLGETVGGFAKKPFEVLNRWWNI
jgi:hypothetical protein